MALTTGRSGMLSLWIFWEDIELPRFAVNRTVYIINIVFYFFIFFFILFRVSIMRAENSSVGSEFVFFIKPLVRHLSVGFGYVRFFV